LRFVDSGSFPALDPHPVVTVVTSQVVASNSIVGKTLLSI